MYNIRLLSLPLFHDLPVTSWPCDELTIPVSLPFCSPSATSDSGLRRAYKDPILSSRRMITEVITDSREMTTAPSRRRPVSLKRTLEVAPRSERTVSCSGYKWQHNVSVVAHELFPSTNHCRPTRVTSIGRRIRRLTCRTRTCARFSGSAGWPNERRAVPCRACMVAAIQPPSTDRAAEPAAAAAHCRLLCQ